MNTIEKLKVLSADSQYDLACACGTSDADRRKRGLDGKWLYPVAMPQGGHSILLKTLLSNTCSNDCKYCPLRAETNVRRCTLQPEEVARIFLEYVRKRKVFGLFLSSGVIGNPDYTMDRINTVARLLRCKHKYRGYIHLKIIPGVSDAAIEDSISLASAVSLNIETPGKRHFEALSDKKDYDNDIIRPINLMAKLTGRGMKHSRVKCTTQYIVGASDETDSEIMSSMSDLYNQKHFQRVYFSAYQKGLGHPDIPGEQQFLTTPGERFIREHRLYQVDFLMRRYGFNAEEVPLDAKGNLSLEKDPKELWADMHPEVFPVRINSADREMLLRVPGIGPDTVKRILELRSKGRISKPEEIGVRGKRLEKIKIHVVFE
ncbi:MAG TPA: radical SAM protein [Dissulfurispiraceae bacterium]|nr:radical SAM protein [Dissulfurispiraceae bacterium]